MSSNNSTTILYYRIYLLGFRLNKDGSNCFKCFKKGSLCEGHLGTVVKGDGGGTDDVVLAYSDSDVREIEGLESKSTKPNGNSKEGASQLAGRKRKTLDLSNSDESYGSEGKTQKTGNPIVDRIKASPRMRKKVERFVLPDTRSKNHKETVRVPGFSIYDLSRFDNALTPANYMSCF